jgi:tight adherence protein C
MGWTLQEIDQRVRDWNDRRKKGRHIRQAMPEALDLLALVLQAGLDFQVALQHYVDRGTPGPLRDELAKLQTEIRVGAGRVQALRHLMERHQEPSLREMAKSVIQGLELGASLAPVLRAQAQALRYRQSCDAEKAAAQAPLKLLFPLFVFIFPTIFIILFGPMAIQYMQGGFQ